MKTFSYPQFGKVIRTLVFAVIALLIPAARAQETCGEWTLVEPPAGATSAVLEVQARSATDAFAFASPLGLIRWDGNAWDQFPVPIQDLQDEWSTVWIREFGLVGPSHLFLAGAGSTGPFSNDQVLMFYDGTDWDHVSLTLQPDIQGAPRNGAPNAVVGAAPDDVWILGIADGGGDGVSGHPLLTVHWDGSQLTEFLTPGPNNRQNNVYDGVAIATNDVWAVGDYNNTNNPDGLFRGLTYHWDGTSWSHIPNPSEDITQVNLYTVTAIASDDVWAAGGGPGASPFFMHWDGSGWSVVPSPATTGTIYKIAAIASDDVWAVDHPAQVPVIGKFYHWDGIEWSIVLPPEIPGMTAVERHGGLVAVGPCDVWAVGSQQVGQEVNPLIERLQSYGGATSAAPGVEIPSLTGITQVAPNPFNPRVDIAFNLEHSGPARLSIHDLRGRLVRTLHQGALEKGLHTKRWDGTDEKGMTMASGTYIVSLQGAGQRHTRKVVLLQ